MYSNHASHVKVHSTLHTFTACYSNERTVVSVVMGKEEGAFLQIGLKAIDVAVMWLLLYSYQNGKKAANC